MNTTTAKQPPSAPFDAWAVIEFWMRRWRWVAAWTAAAAIAGAYVARAVWSHSFTSTAELVHYEPSAVDDTYRPRELPAPSLVVMLQAPGFFESVGSHLKPPLSAKELAERLKVTLDRNNDVVTVSATGGSREETVALVDQFCAEAIAYTQSIQRQEAVGAGAYVGRELKQVESEIAATQKSIPAYSQASVSAIAAEPDVAAPVPSDLPQRIQSAREQLEDLLTRFTDAHPLVREQRARLAALEEEQRRTASSAPKGPASGTRAAPVAPNGQPTWGRVTPEEVAMGERLRSLETERALLGGRERAIQPFRDNPPGYFRVLMSADANPTQLHRHRLEMALFAFLGAFLGFCGSASMILLGEFLDNRIKTRADVRRVTGLPLLATLGDLRRLSAAAQVQWGFRAWTALQSRLSISPNHGMVCGITSANSRDGRSTWINLLSRAASSCGFRVLTITAAPSEEMSAELARHEKLPPPAKPNGAQPDATLMTTNVLSTPGQIVEKLTSAECPPVVSIPLPGWVWNLERRRQWRAALEAWRDIDHIVIFVELPPAFVAESVLLAENIPNLIWLADSNKSSAAETLTDLETLRDASCNLVGAVLNREHSAPVRGRFSRWLGSAALALLLGVCAHAPNASAAGEPIQPAQAPAVIFGADPARRAAWQQRLTLGPGDVLSFHLFGYPELAREEVPIGPDGRVSYLEAENVVAAGLTVDELRERMSAELGRFRRAPQVFITPVSYRSKRYFMLGTVVQKGVFTLDRPTTVVEAVARARGFETGVSHGDIVEVTDFSRSFLARGGHRVPVDFERLFVRGDLSQNVALEPDDYLFFPASYSGEIYVLGAVGQPGPVPYESDVSALSAIASRGGFSERAWKRHVLVVRGSLDHPVAFTVDTAGALNGSSPNLALQPGDLVYVSDRPWYKAEELLDHAASAFVESAVVTWTGLNVGPDIFSKPKP